MAEQLALEVQQTRAMQPMEMIQVAFQKAVDSGGTEALAVANMILEQMAKQRDYEDREHFQAALRRIQDKLKPIVKDCENKETHSRYASAESVDDAIDRLMQEERMSLSFEPESHPVPEMVRIVGILSLGAFSKRYPLDMPADGKGAKGGGVMSRTHATGSAITYGKRYLKNMIFNLRFKEKDDDGNRALGGKQPGQIDERRSIELRDNILNAGNRGELQRLYLLALGEAEKIGDAGAIREFIAAKDKRFKEIK
jgi:hypothetical protein